MAGSGFGGVNGDGRNLGNRREGGGVEGGHGGHGGDSGCSWLTSGWWGKESGGSRAKLCAFKHRAAPAGRTSSLPAFLSNGVESVDIDVTILVNRHFSKLLRERDHSSERFREGRASKEDLPSSLEESQLIDVGETGEEEGQTRGVGGSDELDGDERERRKSDYQGRFDGSEVDPETVDLHKIVRGGRHYGRGRKGRNIRKKKKVGRVVS